MIKPTILFDLDGTLIDSTRPILRGFKTAFGAFDMDIASEEAIKSLIGYPLDIMFEKLGAPNHAIDGLIEAYKGCYRSHFMSETELLNGAQTALEMAFSFADVGVVTTKNSIFSRPLLKHLGVGQYIGVIIGRNDVSNPKPDSEPILKALAALNKTQKNCFMVGDTRLDALAAKAAKCVSVGVSCGYESEASLKEFCDFVEAGPFEAVERIKKLMV